MKFQLRWWRSASFSNNLQIQKSDNNYAKYWIIHISDFVQYSPTKLVPEPVLCAWLVLSLFSVTPTLCRLIIEVPVLMNGFHEHQKTKLGYLCFEFSFGFLLVFQSWFALFLTETDCVEVSNQSSDDSKTQNGKQPSSKFHETQHFPTSSLFHQFWSSAFVCFVFLCSWVVSRLL